MARSSMRLGKPSDRTGRHALELAPRVLDPLPMLVNERTDLGRARAARHDELQGMGRHESQASDSVPAGSRAR